MSIEWKSACLLVNLLTIITLNILYLTWAHGVSTANTLYTCIKRFSFFFCFVLFWFSRDVNNSAAPPTYYSVSDPAVLKLRYDCREVYIFVINNNSLRWNVCFDEKRWLRVCFVQCSVVLFKLIINRIFRFVGIFCLVRLLFKNKFIIQNQNIIIWNF